MSLHQLAKHMQSAGRGEDKVLVHMTPKEVQGLQSLAMAHGGSLTINPATGLPEAGFLSSILPMVAGLGLSLIPGVGPMMAAGLVGGGTALATGSLQKGLMAGLGAYGGAGLGAGLAGAGAAEAGASALSSVTPVAGAVPSVAAPTLGGSIMAGAPGTASAAAAPTTLGSGFFNSAPSITAPAITANAPLTASSQMIRVAPAATAESNLAAMGRGAKGLTSMSGIESVWNAMPKGSGMALGAGLLSAMTPEQKALEAQKDKGMIRPYTLDRQQNQSAYAQGANENGRTNTPVYGSPFDSSERQYFTDTYTAGTPYKAPGPEYKATGGLTALAVGGPVEEMAAQNAVGANTMYPQSGLQTSMYSNPQLSRPVSSNVVSPSGDVAVDPYTGEQKFAEGGVPRQLSSYSFNPQTQQFTRQAAEAPAMQPVYGNSALGPEARFMSMGRPQNVSAALNANASNAYQPRAADDRGWNGTLWARAGVPDPSISTTRSAPVGSSVSGGVVTPYVQPPAPQYATYPQPAPQVQQAPQPDSMSGFYDYMRNQMGGMQGFADGGDVSGGYNLGGYSDGGRLLRGPGDGVSDSIPAQIGDKQPARLADGEFVVPARIVSELGNGSTEAGARQLYKMMERVQHNRRKSIGKDKTAVDAKSAKFLPA